MVARQRSATYSDIRQEALKLHVTGKSIKEISEFLNVHRNSVSKWVKTMHKCKPNQIIALQGAFFFSKLIVYITLQNVEVQPNQIIAP